MMKRILSVLLLISFFSGCSQRQPEKVEQYHSYWLTNSGLGEYVDLLISKQPIRQLASVNFDKTKALPDSIAIIVRTYEKDSIWNVDRRPFKSVASVQSVDADKQAIVLNETKYQYIPAQLPDIIALLEKPWGKIPIHRIHAPIAGAEEFTEELLGRLKKQLEKERGPNSGGEALIATRLTAYLESLRSCFQ